MGIEHSPDWVPAREAVNRISSVCGGDLAAKAVIADRLRDGMVRAHADKAVLTTLPAQAPGSFLSSGVRLQERGARTKPREAMDREIDPSAWLKSDDWQEDLTNWRWGPGDFSVSWLGYSEAGSGLPQRVMRHFQFYGVKFAASDIDQIAPRTDTASPPQPSPEPSSPRAPPLPPVTDADVSAWIEELVSQGVKVRDVTADLVKARWSGRSRLPKRDDIREELTSRRRRLGIEVKEGRPRKRPG